MLICLLVIGAYVAFRAFNRDDLSVRPDPIDLRAAVELGQASGVKPLYPDPVPEGWKPISFDVTASHFKDGPAWALGFHTQDDRFAGVRQDIRSAETLLNEFVDEHPVEGDVITLDSTVARTWTTWTDEGGDTAYVAEVGGGTVLVWGSATPEELQTLVESLTDAKLTPAR